MQLYPNDHFDDFSSASNAAQDNLLCGMNTTPLIDVMLVLIVMLIITIPVQLNSVSLDMPNAISAPTPPSIIRLDIAEGGTVLADGTALPDRAALSALLQARSSAGQQPEVHVHPSSAAPYASVAAVLALTQQLGLTKVGVIGN
jgi:biopolymer transport protein ExbD